MCRHSWPIPTPGAIGKDLVRVVTRNLLPVQEVAPEDQQVLLHGIVSASVSFFDGIAWTDAWDSTATSTLPTGLKFSLVMASRDTGSSAPAPIELVVPVMVVTTTSETQAAEDAVP